MIIIITQIFIQDNQSVLLKKTVIKRVLYWMSTKKFWLYFLLYLEGGGNAAIFNSFKLQTRSPVFMSRFYRVGKFAFVNASNQAFIVYLMNVKVRRVRPFPTAPILSNAHTLCNLDHFQKNSAKSHAYSPFFPKSQVDRVGNYWTCPVMKY